MSVKLALLKSGETLITDVKELVTEETEEKERKVHGYLFVKPKKVDLASPVLLTENSDSKEERLVSKKVVNGKIIKFLYFLLLIFFEFRFNLFKIFLI